MTYNNKVKETNAKYMQNSQVRVPLNWLKSDFEGRVKPAILSAGIPVSTYIKDAVNEKMIRDGLCRPEDIPSEIPGTVRAAIQKYINNDKKTVLYINIDDTMYSYIKADKAGHTWEAAIDEYGSLKCNSISDEDYVVEIRCKGNSERNFKLPQWPEGNSIPIDELTEEELAELKKNIEKIKESRSK